MARFLQSTIFGTSLSVREPLALVPWVAVEHATNAPVVYKYSVETMYTATPKTTSNRSGVARRAPILPCKSLSSRGVPATHLASSCITCFHIALQLLHNCFRAPRALRPSPRIAKTLRFASLIVRLSIWNAHAGAQKAGHSSSRARRHSIASDDYEEL